MPDYLSKTEIAQELANRGVASKHLVTSVLTELAVLASEEIEDGHDFVVPGVAKVRWTLVKARKKGEKYIGFGGAEVVVEKDKPAKAGIAASPNTKLKGLAPKAKDKAAQSRFLRSKAGKNLVDRKS